ncbi:MAG: CvpA family protein [Methylococcaceae bacterium]|nr:CvpA family protein [Methylococcaceae bacterium]
MIWVDYALLGLLTISAIMGLLRGFRVEVYALLIWILGVCVSCIFCSELSIFLKDFISDPVLKIAVAFLGLLSFTLVVGSLIGYLLGEALVRTDFLGRLLGVLMGGMRGLVIVSVLVLLAGLTPMPTEAWWHEAQLIFPFQKIVLRLRDSIPSDLARNINYE